MQKELLFKKGSTEELVKALNRALKADLNRIAEENFNKAKEYEKNKLIEKRERFYDEFLSDIQNCKE